MAQKEFNKMSKEELTSILNSDAIATMDAKSLFELRKAVKAAGLLTVQYDNLLTVEYGKMSKEELTGILNSDAIATMDAKSLFELRKAVKAAGLLTVQYDNMLGIAINNRTYEEIKNSKDYSDEDKALALEARNEYNKKLRTNTEKKLYSVEEILSRAIKEDGKYNFTEMTKGELDFLMKNGIDWNQLNVDKDYKIGQIKATEISKEKGKTEDLSEDVQKSQEFWGNFKNNKTGLSFIVTALENAVKVEAKKEGKTVFTGVDNGNKGFDIVKRDESVEAYKVYDLIIKKAKVSNPKAKIRIKDNVKDPVLRNKILIACAKNNMQPVGNLPEGFDFEALKNIVKDVNDIATINALAERLDDIAVVYPTEEKENVVAVGITKDKPSAERSNTVAGVVQTPASGRTAPAEEKKNNTVAGVVQTPTSGRTAQAEENKKNRTVVAPVILPQTAQNGTGGNNNGHTAGNGAGNPPAGPTNNEPQNRPTVSLKRPWWKKVRDAVIIGGIAFLSFLGVRNCSGNNNQSGDKKQTPTEQTINNFYIDNCCDCDCDCNEEQKADTVRGKTVYIPGKKIKGKDIHIPGDTIKGKDIHIPGDTIKGQDIYIPGDTIQGPDVYLPGDTIYEKVVVPAPKEEPTPVEPRNIPLEPVDTSIKHEKDYELNNALTLDTNGNPIEGQNRDVLGNPMPKQKRLAQNKKGLPEGWEYIPINTNVR